MTSVEIRFRFQGEVRPEVWMRTQENHNSYGIRGLKVDEAGKTLTVEYDATRLDARGVQHALLRAGVPIVEQIPAS